MSAKKLERFARARREMTEKLRRFLTPSRRRALGISTEWSPVCARQNRAAKFTCPACAAYKAFRPPRPEKRI